MSKSLGNVLDPFEVIDQFGTDALRYYCFREVSLRPGRRRLDDHLRASATSPSSPTTTATSPAARWHDRPLPRRHGARRRRRPRAGGGLRRPRDEVCELLDRAEVTQALERIWQRVRRLNRYVEERAPWQLAKDEAKQDELDVTLRSLAEGIRAVTVLLHPYMPETAAKLLAALGDERRSRSTRRRSAPRPRRRDVGAARAALPEAASDRQPHAPRLDPGHGRRDRRRRARRRASRGMLTIGTDAESSRAARWRPPRRTTTVWLAVGRHPNSATGYTDAITAELRELARHPRCAAIGETGLDYYRDYAPRADQERAFAAHIGLARELGKPLVIHTRAADDDTIATLARDAQGAHGDPALLLDARPPRRVPRPRLVDLLRRQRHLPEVARARRSPPCAPRSTASSSRPTRRT